MNSGGVVKFKSRDSPLSAVVRLPLPKVDKLEEADAQPSWDESLVTKVSGRPERTAAERRASRALEALSR